VVDDWSRNGGFDMARKMNKIRKSFPREDDSIDMTERDGVFVPVIKTERNFPREVDQFYETRVPCDITRKGRKGLARPHNNQVKVSNIISDIVTDFFKIVRKEMFR
jgi:hypothetical protein